MGINSVANGFRNLVACAGTQPSKALRARSSVVEEWSRSLDKLRGKFLDSPKSPPPPARREAPARPPMGLHASRLTAGSMLLQRGIYSGIAGLYEKTSGKLMAYDRMKVNAVAASVSWAVENNLMPSKANSIVDIGAAHGGATVQLGKRYQQARILALDSDPQSAKFIEEKIKSDDSILTNPERLETFSGTFQQAFSNGKVEKNSVDLVVMQAVAPYLSDAELKDTLQGIHTALASGGKLVLSCYGDEHLSKDDAKSTLALRSDIQMLEVLESAGLSVECIGNTLQAGDGRVYKKNSREMSDVLKQSSMPEHPEGKYWHSVYLVAIKP